jgi:hypothetical protein
LLARFMFRSIILLADKQKTANIEKQVYLTHDAIKSKFLSELQELMKDRPFDMRDWKDFKPHHGGGGAPQTFSKKAEPSIRSMAEQNDPEAVLKEANLEMGDYVKQKGIVDSLYMIVGCSDPVVLVEHVAVGDPSTVKVKIALEKFLATWCKYDGPASTLLTKSPNVLDHDAIKFDDTRSRVFSALLEHERNAPKRPLQYLVHPTCVHATDEIPRFELKLAPLTPMQKLSKERSSNGVAITHNGDKVYATAVPCPSKVPENQEDAAKFLYIPFWYVYPVSCESDANTKYVSIKTDCGVHIPALQNHVKISKDDRLTVWKPKDAKVKLEGATLESMDDASKPNANRKSKKADGAADAAPKKKAKTNAGKDAASSSKASKPKK